MKIIPLTELVGVVVDDEMYEMLQQWHWNLGKRDDRYYAIGSRTDPDNGGTMYCLMHRIIMDAKPGQQVDHANGNGLDNRLENLRFCTNRQNQHNRKPGRILPKGVSAVGNRFRARIVVEGVKEHLGYYDSAEDAAAAYDIRAAEAFGIFARLNRLT